MLSRISRLWRRNKILLVSFILACAVTVFFGGRMVLHSIYWVDPAHRNQPVAGWMTPRYIARSWHVPPDVVVKALDVERTENGRPPTLAEIAEEHGLSVAELTLRVEEAIALHRDENR